PGFTENREKLLIIAKCVYITVAIPSYIKDLPIDIYTEGFFNAMNRGKIDKDQRWKKLFSAQESRSERKVIVGESGESKAEKISGENGFEGQETVLPHSLG